MSTSLYNGPDDWIFRHFSSLECRQPRQSYQGGRMCRKWWKIPKNPVIKAVVGRLRHRFAGPQTTGMCPGDVLMILNNNKNKIEIFIFLLVFFLIFFGRVAVTASWAPSEPPLQICWAHQLLNRVMDQGKRVWKSEFLASQNQCWRKNCYTRIRSDVLE